MTAQSAIYQPPSNEELARVGTGPIPAGPYYRPDYFELEREAIFKHTWLEIGHICELPEPGSFIVRPLEFANASILITRGKDDKIRAFHNVCTHRGTQLVSEESGNRLAFSCRYHSWTFGYDGQLRAAPDMDRFYVEKSRCNLREIAVDVCAGLIFVNLDKSPAQSLREYLGPFAERLETLVVAKATTFSEYVYEIDANWKVTYDNFQEGYHLRFIHPQTIGPTLNDENPFGYAWKYEFYGIHRIETIWYNANVIPPQVQGLAFGNLTAWAAADGLFTTPYANDYIALFPNFFLLGNPLQHFSHVVMPISAGQSRGTVRLYWIGEDDSATKRFAREYATALARDIHAEDRPAIEAGQRGLSSGALEHIHFQSQEVLCRHFFNTVDEMVQAYKANRSAMGPRS